MRNSIAIKLSGLAVLGLLTACALTEPLEYEPRPDIEEIAKQLDCPVGRTPTCVERLNQPYRCFCMDKEAMRDMLEPEPY